MKRITLTCVLILSLSVANAQSRTIKDLETRLTDITRTFPGKVGISFISDHGDSIGINSTDTFPLMSVMKFHQALAVCDFLNSLRITLDTSITVNTSELNPGTYSPMVKEYPQGGTFTIRQLMDYSLIQSDNNASNILYNRLVNVREVNRFAHGMIQEQDTSAAFHILYSEEAMGMDVNKARANWTTPLAASHLMSVFHDNRNANPYNGYLWDTMSKCKTGENRIPRHLTGQGLTIVHKTGTGGTLPDGTVFSVNDVACITLPDGRHYVLSVFVSDAHCQFGQCEEFIANVSKTIYVYLTE